MPPLARDDRNVKAEGRREVEEADTCDRFFRHGNENEFDGLINVRLYRFGTSVNSAKRRAPANFYYSRNARVYGGETRCFDTP